MNLARNIGLRVPDTSLFQIGPHEIYLVERFDRRILPERVAREAPGLFSDHEQKYGGVVNFFLPTYV